MLRPDSGSPPPRDDRELHSRILAQVSDAVIAIDEAGRITYLNATAERQYGIAAADAIGRPLGSLYEYRWLAEGDADAATASLAASGYWRGENLHVLPDGRTLRVESAVSVLRDGEGRQLGLLAVIRDVSAARRAEAALLELEARQRMALDAAALGTWKHDLVSGLVELDARARLHYGIEAPVASIDDVVAVIHADDRPALQRTMASALDPQTKQAVEAEYRVVDRQGAVRWLSIRGRVQFAVVDGRERAIVGVGTTRDITEQKRAEDALREADRRKDEFLAILAHELRNPLAPIRTAVGILRHGGIGEAAQQRSREIIERQVAHMARLVDDLLDVSRLSRGMIGLQRTRIRLDDALALALETARPLLAERRQRLVGPGVPDPPVWIDADLARLSQVFANLLNNAAKFSAPGGTVTIDVVPGEREVAVRVTDTGEGIAADQLEPIFELFAQGAGRPMPAGGGLGIGLALARRLVTLHGGTLTASSRGPGTGATFTVVLPALPAGGTPAAPGLEGAATGCAGRRVLVVDDNVDAAETTCLLLQGAGCDARAAFGGEEALETIAAFRPDVVLLDIGMPGLDGIDTCRRIRTMPGGGSMIVVAVTGWGQDESRRRTRLAGFDAHLVKPVAPEDLLGFVRDLARPAS